MAMNPMQRKVRNSFLFGFIVALLIGAVIIGLLIMKNKQAQEEIAKIQEENKLAMAEVYVTEKDVKIGEPISAIPMLLPAQSIPDNAIKAEDLEKYMNDDGEYEMLARVDMKEKTALTSDMIEQSKDSITYRMVEYNMISLPSMLEEGDYIDIRLACLGYDCVVLSKVEVQSCNNTTVWLKLSESQLLTLNYAIIESYIIQGTKLYATQYTDEAQAALNTTYVPDYNTVSLIQKNINPDGDEWDYFSNLYREGGEVNDENALAFRTDIISQLRSPTYTEDDIEAVTDGYNTEKSNIQAARDALMGDLGY